MREEESGTEDIELAPLAAKALVKARYKGSATMVSLLLEEEKPLLRTLNLGDCAYMHLRYNKEKGKLKVLFKSAEMQKAFNAPYQAASMSPGDSPYMGQKQEHKVENRDILVTGSDGLFDNLYPYQILECFEG